MTSASLSPPQRMQSNQLLYAVDQWLTHLPIFQSSGRCSKMATVRPCDGTCLSETLSPLRAPRSSRICSTDGGTYQRTRVRAAYEWNVAPQMDSRRVHRSREFACRRLRSASHRRRSQHRLNIQVSSARRACFFSGLTFTDWTLHVCFLAFRS